MSDVLACVSVPVCLSTCVSASVPVCLRGSTSVGMWPYVPACFCMSVCLGSVGLCILWVYLHVSYLHVSLYIKKKI